MRLDGVSCFADAEERGVVGAEVAVEVFAGAAEVEEVPVVEVRDYEGLDLVGAVGEDGEEDGRTFRDCVGSWVVGEYDALKDFLAELTYHLRLVPFQIHLHLARRPRSYQRFQLLAGQEDREISAPVP